MMGTGRVAAAMGSVALAAWVAGLAPTIGCGDGAARTDGAACGHDDECASRFCDGVCRAAAGDDDGDGLGNAVERGLGSDPDGLDSDRDGILDAAEGAADADRDGRPDIVESALVDADRDCLPAELDADDASPDADASVLARALCRRGGVCAEGPGAVVARCEQLVVDGAPRARVVCDYAAILGWDGPVERRCDGRDNDCDGSTDEDLGVIDSTGLVRALGDDCVGTGACASRVGVVECDPSAAAVCSVDAGGSAAPSTRDDLDCDAIDNDCDGVTDEGVAWVDPATGETRGFGEPCAGLGACGLGQGVVECAAGAARGTCSTEPGGSDDLSAPESCDGLDDDCDGRVDEGLFWDGPDGQRRGVGEACGVGRCRGGQVVCGAGTPACSTAALAGAERCNGEDDDCDGRSDEPVDLTYLCPTSGVCADLSLSEVRCDVGVDAAEGSVACIWGEPERVEAVETRCNGLDDDCDGLTDEALAPSDGEPLGAPCEGRGVCAAIPGSVVCAADGQGTRCSADVTDAVETCDGLDDDCDGRTDEAPSDAPPSCSGGGVCADYASVPAACVDGGWRCAFVDDPAWQEVEARCDGLDNDCDGATDEGLARAPSGTFALVPGRSPPDRRAWPIADSPVGPLLFGGVATDAASGEPVLLGDLWRYDAPLGTWERLGAAGAPTARAGHALAWEPSGAVLVVHGGFTSVAGPGPLGPDGAPVGSMYVYAPGTQAWSVVSEDFGGLAPALFARRFHQLTALGDGRLVLTGGLVAGLDAAGDGGLGAAAPIAVGVLSAVDGGWRCAWTVPVGAATRLGAWRFGHAASALGGKVALVGGRALGGLAAAGLWIGEPEGTTEVVAELDAAGDFPAVLALDDRRLVVAGASAVLATRDGATWSVAPVPATGDLPVGRGGALAGGAGAPYLLEGTTALGDSGRRTFALAVEAAPSSAAWGRGVAWDAPAPRVGAALALDPTTGAVYLLGGARFVGRGALQDAWRWDAGAGRWRVVVPASSPAELDPGRPAVWGASVTWDAAAGGATGAALIWGGRAADGPSRVLWTFDGAAYRALPGEGGASPGPDGGRWADARWLFAPSTDAPPGGASDAVDLWNLSIDDGQYVNWSAVPPPEAPLSGEVLAAGPLGGALAAVVRGPDGAVIAAWDPATGAWREPVAIAAPPAGPMVWDAAHGQAFALGVAGFAIVDLVAGTTRWAPLVGASAPLGPALLWVGEPPALLGFGGVHTSATSLDGGPASARTFLFDLECAP